MTLLSTPGSTKFSAIKFVYINGSILKIYYGRNGFIRQESIKECQYEDLFSHLLRMSNYSPSKTQEILSVKREISLNKIINDRI